MNFRCMLQWRLFSGAQRRQKCWSSAETRSQFINYFATEHKYTYIPSIPVVPFNDNSLFYVNSGMNQFKSLILGKASSSAFSTLRKVVNSQKCIRASGKHNDFSDVGRDTTHHTFFEMLGNWSFNGCLSKKEVCAQALKLLTEVYGLPLNTLFITYFGGCPLSGLPPDQETLEVWKELGIPLGQLRPGTSKDNFWEVDVFGPCGPCTEIHYSSSVPPSWDNAVELWNIVFMQYTRENSDSLKKLPDFHVDTGMGLERLCTILQQKTSNYQTDLFTPILAEIQGLTKAPGYEDLYGQEDKNGLMTAYRIVADHVRMATVALSDGAVPAEIRGATGGASVLKKVLVNACYQASLLGAKPPFLSRLAPLVAESLHPEYPDIAKNLSYVKDVLDYEEDALCSLTSKGMGRFKQALNRARQSHNQIQTDDLIDLRFSCSFSKDLISLLAAKENVTFSIEDLVKEEEHRKLLGGQVETLGGVGKKHGFDLQTIVQNLAANEIAITDDSLKYLVERDDSTGSYSYPASSATVVGIVHGDHLAAYAPHFEECLLVMNRTPFYAEAGGQQADTGMICGQETAIFEVNDVFTEGRYVFHKGILKCGAIQIGDAVAALVDNGHRFGCSQHHTSAHILMASLEQVLKTVVKQTSSFVGVDMGKLCFWSTKKITQEEILSVEDKVNEYIEAGLRIDDEEMSLEKASALASVVPVRWIPGVTYPDPVRLIYILPSPAVAVLSSGHDYSAVISVDPCCGTHLLSSADIKQFRILTFLKHGSTTTLAFVAGALALAADTLAESLSKKVNETWEQLSRDEEHHPETLKLLRDEINASKIPLRAKSGLMKRVSEFIKIRHKQQLKFRNVS